MNSGKLMPKLNPLEIKEFQKKDYGDSIKYRALFKFITAYQEKLGSPKQTTKFRTQSFIP